MNEKKYRILFFSLGLLLGIIIGGVTVRIYADKVYAESRVSQNVVSKLFGKVIKMLHLNKSQNTKNENESTVNSVSELKDTLAIDVTNESNDLADTKKDSLLKNNDVNSQNDEEIIVLKDQLLKTVSIRPKIIFNATLKKDSTEIKSSKKPLKEAKPVTIEFWQNPLNYKGYKYNGQKLLLYGMNPEEKIMAFNIDNSLYLKYQEQFVNILPGSNFKSFEKVNDPEILEVLETANNMK